MAQVLGFLPLMWQIPFEFPVPGFHLDPTLANVSILEVNQYIDCFLYPSAFHINETVK